MKDKINELATNSKNKNIRRTSSSGILHHVALVRTNVSEEHRASIIRMSRIGKLATLTVTGNRRKLRRDTII
jgi:hypothetical protein